jgi:SAM-dependent methyltransferase
MNSLWQMDSTLKSHWQTIYQTKTPSEVSWTQEDPQPSLEWILQLNLPFNTPIIDVGGGDSMLVDKLIAQGFTDITVLDISAEAIERAKRRLGPYASQVHWVVSDILEFKPSRQFGVWHDRAAFHFQTDLSAIDNYLEILLRSLKGFFIVGTFSTEGPTKCSGLDITQYDETRMCELLSRSGLQVIKQERINHTTPKGATQNFLFTLAALDPQSNGKV